VISDDTLQFTPGGGTAPGGIHSFVAEIARPECVPGRNGQATAPSLFLTPLSAVVAAFESHFTNISGGWNQPEGAPAVRITGIGFFDRNHGQTGPIPKWDRTTPNAEH